MGFSFLLQKDAVVLSSRRTRRAYTNEVNNMLTNKVSNLTVEKLILVEKINLLAKSQHGSNTNILKLEKQISSLNEELSRLKASNACSKSRLLPSAKFKKLK